MKKMLFISNITRRITNFSLPSIEAAQDLGYEFHMAANLSNFNDDASKYNVKLHHIDLARNPFSIKNVLAYKQMMILLNQEKFDVIHCNTPIGGILGRLCGKRAKTPKVIYTAHGFHFYKGAPLINRTLFKWAELAMARYTDAIITINDEDYITAQSFKLRNNGRVYYLPGVGVDTNAFRFVNVNKYDLRRSLGLTENDIIMIAMGDLIPRKNYKSSLQAIAKASNPNLKFLICGKGPELDNLKHLSENLNISQQVLFLGYRTDIKELLSIADIFLFTTYQEGLPRSLMEAMAAGLPCIASKIRGITDLIEEGVGGFLRLPNDIEGFAEAINLLANNEDLRKSIGHNNIITIKKFDVSNVKIEMKKIYENELLNKNDEHITSSTKNLLVDTSPPIEKGNL